MGQPKSTHKPAHIRRNLMLKDLDIRLTPENTHRIFSIKFVSGEGKLYFIPQAYCRGAGRMNMKAFRFRGIQPCDCKGNPEGHVYPVSIDNILEYNRLKVIL